MDKDVAEVLARLEAKLDALGEEMSQVIVVCGGTIEKATDTISKADNALDRLTKLPRFTVGGRRVN